MQKGRMEMKKKWAAIAALSLLLAFGGTTAFAADILAGQASTITVQTSKGDQPLKLTNEWDKVFPKSDLVDHQKVTFHNRYGITLAADMYTPKNAKGKLPAIAVAGPFGAVKEQSSGLYAQKLAEMGYLTIAFDPSFTGESGGTPRDVASPDINTKDFSALHKRQCRSEPHRHPRHLRMGRYGSQCSCHGYKNQGDSHFHHV